MSKIFMAQAAIVAALQACPAFSDKRVTNNEALRQEPADYWVNVVRARRVAEILDECMGLGEDLVEIDFAQTYQVEWIVRREDDVRRQQEFEQGLLAIQTVLHADRTLGGIAQGLTVGPGNFEDHVLATAPKTSAVVVPVRVVLTGLSPID